MSRVPTRTRRFASTETVVALAGLTLAACSSPSSGTIRAVGTPSISISVPLTQVACTPSDICVAVGTSNASVGPTTTAQARLADGRWVSVFVPPTSLAYVGASSCWSNACLFGGSTSAAPLLWRYDTVSHSFSSITAPAGSTSVFALSCFAAASCALAAHTGSGSQIWLTEDGGDSWTTLPAPPTTAGEQLSDVVCTSSLRCVAVIQVGTSSVIVMTTTNGASSWSVQTSPTTATWTSVSSLSCHHSYCTALVRTSNGWRIARTSTFAMSWKSIASPDSPSSLACTTSERCVVGGYLSSGDPWLAIVSHARMTTVALRYVPSSILDVACGRTVCAAIASTTVLSLRP